MTTAFISTANPSTSFTCNIISVFLYLRNYVNHFDQIFIDSVKQKYQENLNKTIRTISFLHLDVVKHLAPLNLNTKIEERFFGLAIDIVVYDSRTDQACAAIEIHGYQHFMRNKNSMTGNSYLKDKIVKSILGEDKLFSIEIFTWEMLADEHKTEYLSKLLKPLTDSFSN